MQLSFQFLSLDFWPTLFTVMHYELRILNSFVPFKLVDHSFQDSLSLLSCFACCYAGRIISISSLSFLSWLPFAHTYYTQNSCSGAEAESQGLTGVQFRVNWCNSCCLFASRSDPRAWSLVFACMLWYIKVVVMNFKDRVFGTITM